MLKKIQHDSSVVFNKHVLIANYLGNTKTRRKDGLDLKKLTAYHRKSLSKFLTTLVKSMIVMQAGCWRALMKGTNFIWGGVGSCQRGEASQVLKDESEVGKSVRMERAP